ncbi:MAG: hypothetical protein HOC91_11180 [Nitrospinaceae bacterium]|jgi:hypothetical protein|nr:hypothetical protein [Nitrospinaceae bacterium]MBT3821286.1 hypothetical protein [Nitrospinaceae bacterium]MBT4092630.1 hypothetical protein [Nitrospinaceae bacterium]MBT4431068.1 hypothetical protein [Nitrospinaceae bacterium]MBT5367013.1 hypothetical protein [Nitrospinaceae bacterium]
MKVPLVRSVLPACLVLAALFLLPSVSNAQVAAKSPVDSRKYVGSDKCATCHQRIHRQWKQTLHAKMAQEIAKNPDVVIGDFTEKDPARPFEKKGALHHR